MRVGYARVSTADQNLDLQIDALEKDGCERIFTDKISGAKDSRPGLDELVAFVRPQDQVVVWKLDRLGRTMKHLVSLVNELHERDIHIRVLQGDIDTTTSTGRMMFHLFATFAELERDLIVERTRAGLASARARGRSGGRPVALSSEKAIDIASLVESNPEKPIAYWCETFNISRATYFRTVKPILAAKILVK